MFSGPPLPLLPGFRVAQVLGLLDRKLNAGVWLRGAASRFRLHLHSSGRRSDVLIAGDLGLLLRQCTWVVLREGATAVVLQSELVLQWRVLQVVTATPYLACPQRLKAWFPDSQVDSCGFHVPTQSCPPEVVLAECLTHGIPVRETRIIYRAPGPVDATLSAPLR